MAGTARLVAAQSGSTAPKGPGRSQCRQRLQQQQQHRGKQLSAPWPGSSSKEKKKVNCKPKNQEEQEIPFRLREIMKSRQEMKNPISNKKRKKKKTQVIFRKTLEKEAKGVQPDIAVPKFKQSKRETDRAYIQRMERETQHVLFLTKNQADQRPEVQVAPKKNSERKKAYQKRRLDKIQQKEEKAAERLEQELLQDTVKFGEVALQPPELTAKPRTSVSKNQPARRSLMLMRMLLSPGAGSQSPSISLARQRILGEERERAVQAYRVLKKQWQQQHWQQGTVSP